MVNPLLVEARLLAQGLVSPTATSPQEVLTAMGPMQGQELGGVISSIALRLRDRKQTDQKDAAQQVTDAFDRGAIVRGYPMRSTVFALAAEDARWVTELCSRQQRRESRRRLERDGLTDSDIARAHDVLDEHPGGLTRAELNEQFIACGLPGNQSMRYLLIRDMMLHGTAVYGPFRQGDQVIVASDTWLPDGTDLESRFNGDRTAAAAALLRRYLHSHGPADLRDFAWWTKLPVALIKEAATELNGSDGGSSSGSGSESNSDRGDSTSGPDLFEEADGRLHRPGLFDDLAAVKRKVHGTFLLPAFDEIVLGYRDRLSFMTAEHHQQVAPGNRGVFRRTMVRGGKFVGTWAAPSSRLVPSPFRALSDTAHTDVNRAFQRFPRARR
ncbi:MAG: winged helix DNA-binding domain-containing protein [Corynebacterium sp.]|uniref:DNA glycosylase AlkZ-like family protein n=1 Tax=Corynebacterium sp. TaxID=1720 RepID=UPI002649820C|nr:crosslink repair DNA glycosylase YcaQ family protein [Corynebacterium sp.]MDN6282779.1 winged helix DNA-binding domain-containing protein [Corynebacterium sp.]MDN6306306.1 winged helix DNA-binding domain-containing protein [Corynebacterium sp.]MDN6352838.1 winged helix DNA-binding domain-containing protein [Corynebacterium sp.]MDN6368348.1 winged helix DNA-binding domain-containing protein [Corynebacterium sp.]MDN6375987.1 winged helix DNA-binding domain-containing protein [Corynebacterium 